LFGDGGNQSNYYLSDENARHTRLDTDDYSFRACMNLTVDFRTQSDYGTIRAYAGIIAQYPQNSSPTGSGGILGIQFAGTIALRREAAHAGDCSVAFLPQLPKNLATLLFR
jgi:hypothetical protein